MAFDLKKWILEWMTIHIPKDVKDKESYIRGYINGANKERKYIKQHIEKVL